MYPSYKYRKGTRLETIAGLSDDDVVWAVCTATLLNGPQPVGWLNELKERVSAAKDIEFFEAVEISTLSLNRGDLDIFVVAALDDEDRVRLFDASDEDGNPVGLSPEDFLCIQRDLLSGFDLTGV